MTILICKHILLELFEFLLHINSDGISGNNSPENIKENDMYEKDLNVINIKSDNPIDSQSFTVNGTMLEEKTSYRQKSGESTRFNEKSFEKKKSMNILAATDGTRSQSLLKEKAKSGFSRFKDGIGGGIEQGLPSMNVPFKNNVLSTSQLNSFYRRATMMKSFHRGNSVVSAFRDQGDSPAKAERKSASPNKDFMRKMTVANNENYENNVDLSIFKKRFGPNKPEELNTAQVAENFMQKLSVCDKLQALNNKSYSFIPSKRYHGRR